MASLERLSNPQIRPLGLNLTTLPGARLYFYENNSTTPAMTYQDKGGEIPHANPVVADANGIFPQIFLEQKLYRMTLTDKKNIVQPGFPLNDIGQDTIVVPFGPWVETRSYSEGEIVTGSNGNWYSSVGDNNLGKDPVDESGDWENIPIPIASNFTSNVGWTTFSSVDDKISVNFNIATMSAAISTQLGIDVLEQTLSVTGSGNFLGGSLKCYKIGDLVTISSSGNLTHSLLSAPSTATNFIPAAYRPPTTVTTVYYAQDTTPIIAMVTIRFDGILNIQYFDFAGSPVSTNNTLSPLTISFVV